MTTATATLETFDPGKAEAFAGQMIGLVNNAMTSLAISVAQQTGLLDTLATLPPSTTAAIAGAAGLNERYVRECLGALVTAGIVEYDPAATAYRLPAEHAAFLTTGAGPDNIGYFTRYISLFAGVEQQIVECVKSGGGVPYEAFGRFQELQAGETASVFDATLLERTLPGIPGLVGRLATGIDVADVGCGQGRAVNLMARAFPRSRFTGFDISEGGLAAARSEAREWGLTNVSFVRRDAAALNEQAAFDLVTAFDSIHDQVAPRTVLAAIRKALRPGGTFLMVDIAASSRLEENLDHPMAAALYSVSMFHCMTVSLAHGGEGLGTMWGEQKARELLAEAGFTGVETVTIEGDMFNTYYVCR